MNRTAEDLIAGRCPEGWTREGNVFTAPEPIDDEIVIKIPNYRADGEVASYDECKLVRVAPGQWERVP